MLHENDEVRIVGTELFIFQLQLLEQMKDMHVQIIMLSVVQ